MPGTSCSPIELVNWSLRCDHPSPWPGLHSFQAIPSWQALYERFLGCMFIKNPPSKQGELVNGGSEVSALTVLTRWQNLWSTAVERWSHLQSIHIIRPLGARRCSPWICCPFFLPVLWAGSSLASLSDPQKIMITLDDVIAGVNGLPSS